MEPDTRFETVRRILLTEWDPIGVQEVAAAQDEYDSYASGIVGLLRQNPSVDALYRYLRDIETGLMGLDGSRERTRRVAERLLSS